MCSPTEGGAATGAIFEIKVIVLTLAGVHTYQGNTRLPVLQLICYTLK